ncbi:MAG: carbohydrate ABC transporter permease [Acidobacteria bacterium]|nr:carbohydrate ABC transporter permease [Acidobacteriota bacterium]
MSQVALEAERLARGRARVRSRRRRSAARGLRTGLQAVLIAGWCLLPVYWMVAASVRDPGEVYADTLWPRHITLRNYVDAFAPVNSLLEGLAHSAALAVLVTAVVLLLGAAAGYALARFRFPGHGVVIGVVLAASMLPAASLLTPLFALFSTIGWAGTFQALVVPDIALALPFAVVTLAVFFARLPWELEDAALIDGCTRPQAVARVLLPLMVPAIVTVGLLTFILTWNEYVIASVLSVESTVTVTVVIANFSAELTGTAVTMAAGVIAAAPLVVLALLFQRRISAGLTAGSLTG